MCRYFYFLSLPILCLCLLSSCDNSVKGCTDPNSINYNPNAEKSDGSCAYPSQTKKTVCFFFTDCNNSTCGSFGINLLDQVKSTNPANTFFMSVHPNGSDSLFAPAGIDIAAAFGVAGFPDFGVGDQANLITQTAILNALTSESAESPQSGIDVTYQVNPDSIIVTLYGKFYVTDTSSYFAVAYVTEDNVISAQAGLSGSYSHQHVLRGASGFSGIGQLINTQPISNDSYKIRTGIYRDPTWNVANIHVIGVIWRQNGSDFEYVNAND